MENCRICLDGHAGELESDICACRGSSGLVHFQCLLEEYLYMKIEDQQRAACSLCHQRFTPEIRLRLFSHVLRNPDIDEANRLIFSVLFGEVCEMAQEPQARVVLQALAQDPGLQAAGNMLLFRVKRSLAKVLAREGDFDDAQQLLEECAEEVYHLRSSPTDWVWPLIVDANLALLWSSQGLHSRAVAQMRNVVDVHVRNLGEGHRDTLVAQKNYACVLLEACRYHEAYNVAVPTLDQATQLLGDGHPDVKRLEEVLQECTTRLSEGGYSDTYLQQQQGPEVTGEQLDYIPTGHQEADMLSYEQQMGAHQLMTPEMMHQMRGFTGPSYDGEQSWNHQRESESQYVETDHGYLQREAVASSLAETTRRIRALAPSPASQHVPDQDTKGWQADYLHTSMVPDNLQMSQTGCSDYAAGDYLLPTNETPEELPNGRGVAQDQFMNGNVPLDIDMQNLNWHHQLHLDLPMPTGSPQAIGPPRLPAPELSPEPAPQASFQTGPHRFGGMQQPNDEKPEPSARVASSPVFASRNLSQDQAFPGNPEFEGSLRAYPDTGMYGAVPGLGMDQDHAFPGNHEFEGTLRAYPGTGMYYGGGTVPGLGMDQDQMLPGNPEFEAALRAQQRTDAYGCGTMPGLGMEQDLPYTRTIPFGLELPLGPENQEQIEEELQAQYTAMEQAKERQKDHAPQYYIGPGPAEAEFNRSIEAMLEQARGRQQDSAEVYNTGPNIAEFLSHQDRDLAYHTGPGPTQPAYESPYQDYGAPLETDPEESQFIITLQDHSGIYSQSAEEECMPSMEEVRAAQAAEYAQQARRAHELQLRQEGIDQVAFSEYTIAAPAASLEADMLKEKMREQEMKYQLDLQRAQEMQISQEGISVVGPMIQIPDTDQESSRYAQAPSLPSHAHASSTPWAQAQEQQYEMELQQFYTVLSSQNLDPSMVPAPQEQRIQEQEGSWKIPTVPPPFELVAGAGSQPPIAPSTPTKNTSVPKVRVTPPESNSPAPNWQVGRKGSLQPVDIPVQKLSNDRVVSMPPAPNPQCSQDTVLADPITTAPLRDGGQQASAGLPDPRALGPQRQGPRLISERRATIPQQAPAQAEAAVRQEDIRPIQATVRQEDIRPSQAAPMQPQRMASPLVMARGIQFDPRMVSPQIQVRSIEQDVVMASPKVSNLPPVPGSARQVRSDQIPLQPQGISTADVLEKVALRRVNSMRQPSPGAIQSAAAPPTQLGSAAAPPTQLGAPVCGPLQSAPPALQTMSRLSAQEVPSAPLHSMPSGQLQSAYQGLGSMAVPSWPAPSVGGSILASSRAGTQRSPLQRLEAHSYGGSVSFSSTPISRPPAQSLSYNPMTPKSRSTSFQAPSRSPYPPTAGGGISGARMRAGGLQDYDLHPREVKGTGMDALGPQPGVGARFGGDYGWNGLRMPW